MQCPSCGFENADGMVFCTECGTRLQQGCPSCGFENTAQAKFCGKCGLALGVEGNPVPATSRSRKGTPPARKAKRSAASPPTAKPRSPGPEAERRQLTVMFCDLVGSTPLAEKLDPEDLREVVRAYQQTCAEVITHFEGHIAQYLGDGLLVYFGYPRAHEDDAQRAVRAGLGIIEALHHAPLFQAQGVQVRIGVHTGPVVVGDIGAGRKREQLALGETPNLAARLQGLAVPDTIIISGATQRLIAGFFDCHDAGLQSVKGVSAPIHVYRVLRESSAQSRLEADVSTGNLTPLVGRTHEVGLILERWAAAQAGDGQVVLLSGEPGIGKSRLVQEVKERVGEQGASCLEFRCSPYYQNSAFSPIITYLHRVLQVERDDPPPVKLEKLELRLRQYRFPQADTLALLATLLSLPQPAGRPPLTLSLQRQKQKTREALVAWLVEEAEQAAAFCAWEDLHWADPSTLELLGLLLDQIPTTRLLVLLTARPEFTPSWSSRTHLTSLTLARLPRTQAAELITKVTGGKALPVEVQQQIVSKTDGVPLFVEELTKMVLESRLLRETNGHYELTGPLPPLAIPATLHDSLMARLDKLATVKEVAQIGAVLGREFSYDLLQAIAPVEERALQQALTKLIEAEVLYQRGERPQARYLFKHALLQDAAYQSLLKSTRQHYHKWIAQVLEERFPETSKTQPELVAQHYTEAGFLEQAILYWQQAGQQAIERSANTEAVSHLSKGLALLKTLPETSESIEQELSLQITLAVPLMAGKGYAAPEVELAYSRARELCQQVGETPRLFSVLYGLWGFYEVRAEHTIAHELGERCLSLSQQVHDPALVLESHAALGQTLFLLGELTKARVHLEQSIALYDPERYRSHAFLYGHDPGMQCLAHAAFVLWHLGYPDQAVKRMHEALTLAQDLSHPHTLAFALFLAAETHYLWRDEQTAQERTTALIALAREQEFPFWLAAGIILQGWALVRQGQGEEGITQMRHGLAAYQATGAEIVRIWFLLLVAEAYGKVGQDEEGLTILAEALGAIKRTGEHIFEAELYQLKGTLTLRSKVQDPKSQVKDAEACFHRALDIARQQQAKSLELRAVMSLSRLWQHQGKKDEARQLLAEIYGWFTEGFDTKDLQEAKALLEELS
jgi:class 3 adenylate cyclase/predicted ATPase